ncbi:MAG: NUDIX domain-containing protein [Candidatus Altiarchaeales archaeon]|nr:NUDIX domain-containing protein [Candidatus Altiarchaeales archaeon]
MPDKILYETDYLTLIDRDGWIMVRNMTEIAVGVLPFRAGGDETEYLARIEPMPAHDQKRHLCALTGSVEEGEEPRETARRELFEESGYKPERPLIELGFVYTSKNSTTKMFLFAIDVTGAYQGVAPGDGTETEAKSTTKWLSKRKAMMVPDATFCSMMARLSLWFEDNVLGE